MSEKAILRRLRQIDGLHELSLALLRAGRDHFERQEDSREKSRGLARFRRYLVEKNVP